MKKYAPLPWKIRAMKWINRTSRRCTEYAVLNWRPILYMVIIALLTMFVPTDEIHGVQHFVK